MKTAAVGVDSIANARAVLLFSSFDITSFTVFDTMEPVI